MFPGRIRLKEHVVELIFARIEREIQKSPVREMQAGMQRPVIPKKVNRIGIAAALPDQCAVSLCAVAVDRTQARHIF